jgi:hypothetical protein
MGPIDWQKVRPLSKMPNRLQPMSCGFHEGYDRKVGTYVVPFTILHARVEEQAYALVHFNATST